MQRSPRWLQLAASYGSLLFGGRAPTPRSLEELVAASDVIILGRCQRAASVWRERSLLTRYAFRVGEWLKGTSEAEITVTVPGGVDLRRSAPVVLSAPEAPSFLPGDSAVLMLDRIDAGEFAIVGLGQGSFVVRGDQVYELRRRAGQITRERSRSLSLLRLQIAAAIRTVEQLDTA